MNLKKSIIKQFGKPTGIAGRFVGWLMSFKNNQRVEWTVERLMIKSSDVLLEIGYGPGVTIEKVANDLSTGLIVGIDHSKIMQEQASKRNKRHIENGKVKLECGTVFELKYPENYFDVIFASNVHFFWKNPTTEFSHLVRLLKPHGRLVMVFQPRWARSEEDVITAANKTVEQYKEVGLTNIELDVKPMSPVTCVYTAGHKL